MATTLSNTRSTWETRWKMSPKSSFWGKPSTLSMIFSKLWTKPWKNTLTNTSLMEGICTTVSNLNYYRTVRTSKTSRSTLPTPVPTTLTLTKADRPTKKADAAGRRRISPPWVHKISSRPFRITAPWNSQISHNCSAKRISTTRWLWSSWGSSLNSYWSISSRICQERQVVRVGFRLVPKGKTTGTRSFSCFIRFSIILRGLKTILRRSPLQRFTAT